MRIQIASDLHLDLLQQRFPDYRIITPANADVLVIAGDIHSGTAAIDTFSDWPVPVIYVAGNHEAYHHDYDRLILQLRDRAAGTRVHFLENDQCIIGGVRFLGCCLWTDYRVTGGDQRDVMMQAEAMLRDHRLIHTANGSFGAADALQRHVRSRDWLGSMLAQDFDGPSVVVTHHAPHPGSIHPRYAGMAVNAAFVSDLTTLLARASLWIHGHVHDSFDYQVAGTRIVANPRGYARNLLAATSSAEIAWENPVFDPLLVVQP